MSLQHTPPAKKSPSQEKLRELLEVHFGRKLFALPDSAWSEFGLTFGVSPKDGKEVFSTLRDDEKFLFNMLVDITAVDWLDRRSPRFEVVYQLLSLTHLHRLCVKITVTEEEPVVESVRDLWPAANFLEREVWDMYGIDFNNHGDLRRILLYDEFVGYPLRKDYPIRKKQPRIALRMPETRNDSSDMWREELVSLPVRNSQSKAMQPEKKANQKT